MKRKESIDWEALLLRNPDEIESTLDQFIKQDRVFQKAPSYLKEEILEKCQKKRFKKEKNVSLFAYSFRVCTAVVLSLGFLFSISPEHAQIPKNLNDKQTMQHNAEIPMNEQKEDHYFKFFLTTLPDKMEEWLFNTKEVKNDQKTTRKEDVQKSNEFRKLR